MPMIRYFTVSPIGGLSDGLGLVSSTHTCPAELHLSPCSQGLQILPVPPTVSVNTPDPAVVS